MKAASKKFKLVTLLTTISLLAFVAASNSSDEGSKSKTKLPVNRPVTSAPVMLKIGTAPIGGAQYTMGIALEQLWISKAPGIKISSQSTGGSVQNINLIGDKEVQIGFTATTLARLALAGEGPYKGNQVKSLRILSYVYPALFHLVVGNKPQYKTMRDLKGETISCGEIGSVMDYQFRQLVASAGMKDSDFKIEHLSHQDAADAIKDGHIAGLFYATSVPNSVITELLMAGKTKILGLDAATIKNGVAANPDLYASEIPAKTYPNMNENLPTIAGSYVLVVDAGVPEDAVYQLTKIIYDNHDALVKQHKFFSYTTLKNSMYGLGGVALHPGALKYYREKGVVK